MPYRARRALVRLTQPSFTVSAAVVLFNDKGNVLLLKHVLRANRGGWGVPGGFLNVDEQPSEALKRELFEEAGIELQSLRLVSVRTIGNHVEIIYRADSEGVLKMKLKESEILAARWFTIDEAKQAINPAQFKQIEFARRIGENCNL
jgi:ADP-ribose pyrophosphatase YjhB (NUDIX family)